MSSLLQAAEGIDYYRARCMASDTNRVARQGHTYEPFFVTPDVAAFMNEYAAATPLLQDSRIVVMHPSADNGFPHTRPKNLICMPAGVCKRTMECRETLLHEGIHLHQRAHMNQWYQYCIAQGWAPQPSDTIPPQLLRNVRINPDTMMIPFWSWQDFYVPLPLFTGEAGLDKVEIKWMDLRNYSLLSPPASFTVKYGMPSQPEHPFEIMAVRFAAAGYRSSDDIFNEMAR
jgi:hypothetical protein